MEKTIFYDTVGKKNRRYHFLNFGKKLLKHFNGAELITCGCPNHAHIYSLPLEKVEVRYNYYEHYIDDEDWSGRYNGKFLDKARIILSGSKEKISEVEKIILDSHF